MLAILGVIFIIIILLILATMAWGYLFGNGTSSRKNRYPGGKLQSKITNKLYEIFETRDRNSKSDETTLGKLMLTLVIIGVLSGIFYDKGPFAKYQKEIEENLRQNKYDIEILTLIIISYTLAQLTLYKPKTVTKSAVKVLLTELKLSKQSQILLQKYYEHILKETILGLEDQSISFAEGPISAYVINPQDRQNLRGNVLINLHLRTAYVFQFQSMKDTTLPKAANLFTLYS